MSNPAVEPEQDIPLEEPESPSEPTEPETAPEPTPEPAGPPEPSETFAEGEEGEEGEVPPPHAPLPEGAVDAKAIDRIYQKVEREGERHKSRIAEIVGKDFEALTPCPLCSHFAAGFLGLVELPEDALPTMRALLGMPDLTTYAEAEDARTCPRCEGKGRVLTGSKVPGYEVKDCAGCGGIGWIGEGAPAGNGEGEGASVSPITGPTVYPAETDDPQVASLRERGFTVIPPMRTG